MSKQFTHCCQCEAWRFLDPDANEFTYDRIGAAKRHCMLNPPAPVVHQTGERDDDLTCRNSVYPMTVADHGCFQGVRKSDNV